MCNYTDVEKLVDKKSQTLELVTHVLVPGCGCGCGCGGTGPVIPKNREEMRLVLGHSAAGLNDLR